MDGQRLRDEFLDSLADVGGMLDVFERIPGAMFMIKNSESRYIYMSRALREAINLPAHEEIAGKTDYDLFPRMIAESFRQNDALVFREDRPLINEIHVSGGFLGPTKWFFSSKFPLHGRDGAVIGLLTLNSAYDEVLGRDAELNELLPAVEHVARHFGDRLTAADLAARCGLSASHFMRLFKQRLKMTVHQFIDKVRLRHALDTLERSRSPIASIAQRCGFYDQSAFVKRFKQWTGTTPARHRREHHARFQRGRTLTLADAAPAAMANGAADSHPVRE